jgi:branched-chain amino acid transport system substrate-binding protein
MDLWADAASRAGSIEPGDVLVAMKDGGTGKHAFGDAKWWGTELFGIDNALVGDWPVVVIENGKAVIKDFRSIPDWWDKHGDILVRHFTDLGQMHTQRG